MVADEIIKRIAGTHTDLISYADDFILIFAGNTRRALEIKVNSILERFVNIINSVKLTISPQKSQAMLFGRFTLQNRRPIFKLYGNTIPIVDNIKYLGFTLDSKFNWIQHMEIIRENIRNFVANIAKTSIRDTGLSTHHRKIWYLTVIEKRISYGYEVWYQDLKTHALRKLISAQRIGLFSVIKPYRSISNDALCVLAGVVPISIQLNNNSLKYQIITGTHSIDINNTTITKNTLMIKENTFACPFYNKIQNLNFIPHTTSKVKPAGYPQIFTDGSKMEMGTSAAFTVYYGGNFIIDKTIKLHINNSIYQAELQAILSALKWLTSTSFSFATIYTDSLSSVFILQQVFPSNSICLEIFTLLNNHPHIYLNIGWIKAHVGLEGNERADKLAKSVIQDNIYDYEIAIPYPISIVKHHFNNKAIQDWQTHWNTSEKGRDTYGIIKKVKTDFVCQNLITQYYASGHGSFPSYLHKIGKRSDDNCICGKKGDVIHYIFGNCHIMNFHFKFDNRHTLRTNLYNTIFDKHNYHKLKSNYNILNKNYSFIKYTF